MPRRNLTDAEREALRERAREQHRTGSLNAREAGRRGAEVTNARRRAARDAEQRSTDEDGEVPVEVATGAYVSHLLELAGTWLEMQAEWDEDPVIGPNVRADLGIPRRAAPTWGQRERPPIIDELPGDHGLLRHLGLRMERDEDGHGRLVPN